jgi:hypothetical protein
LKDEEEVELGERGREFIARGQLVVGGKKVAENGRVRRIYILREVGRVQPKGGVG